MSQEDKQNILSSLVVRTDDEEVKSVLRLYDPTITTTALRKKLNSAEKGKLIKTMKYIGGTDQTSLNKQYIIHNLICRVQNLFPDFCQICKAKYTVEKDEVSLLACAVCGQGSHNPCLLKLVGLDLDQTDQVAKKINPFQLQGLHYLCRECSDSTIPTPETGKPNRAHSRPLTSTNEDTDPLLLNDSNVETSPKPLQTTHANGPTTGLDHLQAKHANGLQTSPEPLQAGHANGPETATTKSNISTLTLPNSFPSHSSPNTISTQTDYHHDPVTTKTVKPKPCQFYLKGQCRHGISGKSNGVCTKPHPAFCSRLMANGEHHRHGCNKGNSCDMLHPKMCPSSLSARECFLEKCTLYHVRGTRRQQGHTNSAKSSAPLQQPNNGRTNNRDQHEKESDRRDLTHNRQGLWQNKSQCNSQIPKAYANETQHNSHIPQAYPTETQQNGQIPKAFLDTLEAWKRELMTSIDQRIMSLTAPIHHHASQAAAPQAAMTYSQAAAPQAAMTYIPAGQMIQSNHPIAHRAY